MCRQFDSSQHHKKRPTQKGRFLTLYSVMMSCRKAPPEFRFASSTLRNFVPSGAAHEAAAGHALSEPSDNYTAAFSNSYFISGYDVGVQEGNIRKTMAARGLVNGYSKTFTSLF